MVRLSKTETPYNCPRRLKNALNFVNQPRARGRLLGNVSVHDCSFSYVVTVRCQVRRHGAYIV